MARPLDYTPELADRFYVYRILGEKGETVYIGKGVGRRLEHQKRRFMSDGEIVKRFRSEKAAYTYEANLIARLKPPLNIASGGGGSIARRAKRSPKWLREIEKVGTRIYAARGLLRFDLSQCCTPSQIDTIRRVASGTLGSVNV